MFQNVLNDNDQENYYEIEEDKNGIKNIIKKLFGKQNLIIYIISFMISTIGFGDGINPFAIAILAAVCSNDIPIGVVYIVSLIGTGIGFGKEGLLTYFLTSVIFMLLISMFKVKVDEITDNKKFTKHICFATAITKIASLFFGKILIYDILMAIIFVISVGIFYKIFEAAIRVIKDFGIKKAFSIEEILSCSLLFAIAVAGFKDITIFAYSLKNILSILIVLILGWQNGVLVGATSGITIGLVLGLIGGGDVVQIASYAISGMIAGLLNKLGKIGVIVGFILGNAILTYVANGDTNSIIRFQEILIAAIGLLAVPKKVKINVEDLFEKNKYFPVTGENKLQENEDTIYKLNNVTEVIKEVAQGYKEVAATVVEKEAINDICYEQFVNELSKNLENLEDNILYDYLDDENIIRRLYEKIDKKEYINKTDLINILEEFNNYIITPEDETTKSRINEDTEKIIRAISLAYRISKVNSVYDKKIKQSKENMGNQLEGISKAISSIVDNLSQDIKNEEHKNQEEKIAELLNKKDIDVHNIKISKRKDGKTEIDLYTDVCASNKIEECKCERIEKILNKQLNEKMSLCNETCNKINGEKTCKLKYVSADKYSIQIGISKTTKHDSVISGDSNLNVKLEDGKRLLAISDGMGSGPKARQSSNIAIKLLKRLLLSGFDKETSVDLINSSICLNSKDETYATLDIAIVDLFKGNIEFIKNGACPTYVKNKKNVDIIKTISLPTGILENIELDVFDRDIEDGDILVICSDGIIESNTEYENKELWLKYLLENIETDNAQKIADLVLQEAIDNCVGQAKDDMTVMVMKINKCM